MTLDKYLSHKIKLASFFATIMVVYRHSLNYLAFSNSYSGNGLNGWIQDGCMRLTKVAVPFFFIISGFFFFRKNYYVHGEWVEMLKVKFHTLFVPFSIWNVVGLLTLAVTQQDYSFSLHGFLMSEWYGPLWYVRDLMTYMFLVPLYQWLFVLQGRTFSAVIVKIVFVGILICLVCRWMPVDCRWMSSEGMLFFVLGGVLQKYPDLLNKQMPKCLLFTVSAIWLYLSFYSWSFMASQQLNIVVGLVSFWGLLDYLKSKAIDRLLPYNFIIYVLHLYLLKILKLGLAKVFYGNDFIALSAYLVLPVLCSALIIVLAKIMQKILPGFYKVATGGR